MPRYNFREAILGSLVLRSDSVSSATSPAGYPSMYFDGNNVNPVVGGYPAGLNPLAFSYSGDLTIKGVVNFDIGSVAAACYMLSFYGGQIVIYRAVSTGYLSVNIGGVLRLNTVVAQPVNTNIAWAIVRSAGGYKLYVQGVAQATTYSDASTVSAGSTTFFGADGSASNRLKGFLGDIAVYSAALYTSDYSPVYTPEVETASNPFLSNLSLLVHGEYNIPSLATAMTSPGYFQAFAPVWPVGVGATPQVRVLERIAGGSTTRNFGGGVGYYNGTVKVSGTPNLPVHRKVRLFREIEGTCVAETWSDAVTGNYAFSGFDPTVKYTIIAYDYENVFRAVVADNIQMSV